MKTITLKLEDEIYKEMEQIVGELKLSRNNYINEALNFHNKLIKRKVLAKKLLIESKLVTKGSSEILKEFENLIE